MKSPIGRTEGSESARYVVGRVIHVPLVLDEAFQHKNKQCETIFQLPWSAGTDQRTENQAEIECADMNQLAFEDVLMTSQMSPPHRSGIVTMREAPLDQLTSL